MNRSSVVFVMVGVLGIVSAVAWYARPTGLLEATLAGQHEAQIFLFPQSLPAQNGNSAPATESAGPQQDEAVDTTNVTSTSSSIVGSSPTTPKPAPTPEQTPGTPAPLPGEQPTDETGPAYPTSGPLSASLSVSPTMVRPGSSAALTWSSQYAASCILSGTNGDRWTELNSQGKKSGPISSQATFTLTCKGGTEDSPASITKTVKVLIAPSFSE